MSVSYPSKPVTSVNVPDVLNFSAVFNYDFFVPDESVNDSGILSPEIQSLINFKPSISIDSSVLNILGRKIPRFVQFSFAKSVAQKNNQNEFISHQPINPVFKSKKLSTIDSVLLGSLKLNNTVHASDRENNFIKKNLDKIINEGSFFQDVYIGVNFQDDAIDEKLYNLVSGSVERKIASSNQKIINEIELNKRNIFDSLAQTSSPLDKAKAYMDSNNQVKSSFVVDALNNIQKIGVSFIDEKKRKEIVNSKFEKLKNVSMRAQINKKIYGTVVSKIADDAMNIFSDEFSTLIEPANSIEKFAVIEQNPFLIAEDEYDQKVLCGLGIDVDPNNAENFDPSVEVVGYIIDKQEILPNGRVVNLDPIIIENSSVTNAIDTKIKYNSRYLYSIRSVAMVKFQAVSTDVDDVTTITLLISSKSSPKITIYCHETVPPVHPVDFSISWDYKELAPFLRWNLPPTNKQRDIKRFQIFRRKTINEAYQLIKEYNFDDSFVKIQSPETPEPDLVTFTESAVTYYLDKEFTKDSKYIYAIGSVDAHGLTSNYSMQIEVSFDKFKNKIIKRLISHSGAPKSYPNMYLQTLDTFVDTIKNSQSQRVKIYFDPEFLEVTDKDGKNLGLLSTDKTGGKYKMNIINVDYQKMETLDINVDDLRIKRFVDLSKTSQKSLVFPKFKLG